jgi:hypothetical protein
MVCRRCSWLHPSATVPPSYCCIPRTPESQQNPLKIFGFSWKDLPAVVERNGGLCAGQLARVSTDAQRPPWRNYQYRESLGKYCPIGDYLATQFPKPI